MNCLKCPIGEECEVARRVTRNEDVQGVFVPMAIEPYRNEDCPLKQAIDQLKKPE